MTPEIALAAFGLITFATIGFEILFTYATQGFGFGFSAQRPVIERSGFALRVERIYRNQVESAAYVVPALGVAALMDLTVGLACLLIVIGRAGFVLTYYTGIPFIRVPFFALASFPSLYIFLVAFGIL